MPFPGKPVKNGILSRKFPRSNLLWGKISIICLIAMSYLFSGPFPKEGASGEFLEFGKNFLFFTSFPHHFFLGNMAFVACYHRPFGMAIFLGPRVPRSLFSQGVIRFQIILHVRGKGGLKNSPFSSEGMSYFQSVGMKGVSGHFHRLGAGFSSIQFVAKHWVADGRQMDPNLMSSPRFGKNLEIGEMIVPLKNLKFRGRFPAALDIGGHLFAVDFMPADGGLDDARIRFHPPADQGQVHLFDFPALELEGKRLVGGFGFCDKNEARRFLVQPVHDSRPLHPTDPRKAETMV